MTNLYLSLLGKLDVPAERAGRQHRPPRRVERGLSAPPAGGAAHAARGGTHSLGNASSSFAAAASGASGPSRSRFAVHRGPHRREPVGAAHYRARACASGQALQGDPAPPRGHPSCTSVLHDPPQTRTSPKHRVTPSAAPRGTTRWPS